jgi:two-component system, cell cycle response regulator DivK
MFIIYIMHSMRLSVAQHRARWERANMPKKVMIVEDNELNLKLFTDLLAAHKFIVEGVKDGRLALEQAKMFAPDLIIMDIQLPHVSGLDLIEAMQRDDVLRKVPVLAVTAYAGKGDEERIIAAGARGYLSKPVSVMKFLEAVRGIVG